MACEGFLQGVHAEVRLHGVGQATGQDAPARPVHDIDRLDPHQAHQPLHTLAVDGVSLAPEAGSPTGSCGHTNIPVEQLVALPQ